MLQIVLETHIQEDCGVQHHEVLGSEPTNLIEMLRCKNANYFRRAERLTALKFLLYLNHPL
jgi:hypothetical protein